MSCTIFKLPYKHIGQGCSKCKQTEIMRWYVRCLSDAIPTCRMEVNRRQCWSFRFYWTWYCWVFVWVYGCGGETIATQRQMTALFVVHGVIRSTQRSVYPRTVSVCHVITLETTSGPRTRCMTSLNDHSVGTSCDVTGTETLEVWYIGYDTQYHLWWHIFAHKDNFFLICGSCQNESYLSYYIAKLITLTRVIYIINHKQITVFRVIVYRLCTWHAICQSS